MLVEDTPAAQCRMKDELPPENHSFARLARKELIIIF
jgi:hypothetical protein